MHAETRIPHSLRLAIFFLRLSLGLNFFYFGWSALSDPGLAVVLRGRSLGALYASLASPTPLAFIPGTVIAWIFLVVGIALAVGLLTRLASFIAIVLILASFLSTTIGTNVGLARFANDEIIALFALFVIIFGKAGTYFGLDKFLHWRRRRRE